MENENNEFIAALQAIAYLQGNNGKEREESYRLAWKIARDVLSNAGIRSYASNRADSLLDRARRNVTVDFLDR
jgi:hypothetical protein